MKVYRLSRHDFSVKMLHCYLLLFFGNLEIFSCCSKIHMQDFSTYMILYFGKKGKNLVMKDGIHRGWK